MTFDTKLFRRACGQFMTGVTIITTQAEDGTPVGLTANSFSSISLEPPLLLFCLDKRVTSAPAFAAAETFAVHILSAEQQEVSTLFATKGTDRFASLNWTEGVGGAPVIPGYLALFECRKEHTYEGGDHIIYVGKVEKFDLPDGDLPALGYFRGKYFTSPNQG